MKDLLCSYQVEPLTEADFRALASGSLDPLQAWLSRHCLCDDAKPDTMALGPPIQRDDGSRIVRARCSWCGPSSETDIEVGELGTPAIWWLSLGVRLVVDFRVLFFRADGMPDCERLRRAVQAIGQAIRFSVLLAEAEESPVAH